MTTRKKTQETCKIGALRRVGWGVHQHGNDAADYVDININSQFCVLLPEVRGSRAKVDGAQAGSRERLDAIEAGMKPGDDRRTLRHIQSRANWGLVI